MSDPFLSAFFASNYNDTYQDQYNPTEVYQSGYGHGDVKVENIQANETHQDIAGLGLNLGGSGDASAFEGYNDNSTTQYQYNPTYVENSGGDVSVSNIQANETDQSIHGAGVNVADYGAHPYDDYSHLM